MAFGGHIAVPLDLAVRDRGSPKDSAASRAIALDRLMMSGGVEFEVRPAAKTVEFEFRAMRGPPPP